MLDRALSLQALTVTDIAASDNPSRGELLVFVTKDSVAPTRPVVEHSDKQTTGRGRPESIPA